MDEQGKRTREAIQKSLMRSTPEAAKETVRTTSPRNLENWTTATDTESGSTTSLEVIVD